ncbi:TetR/AcrR family transcriptional regulator [Rhodococcus koreensis]|uniref:TetR/AcrR family transcriptional regulator n=1 Tax=Rhodococcus koreensis TaxID=99653 RepID=UPI00198155F8|nr:TetR/AcrR family transcriptional regulator [Rhodococcus koreensis]QSE82924.1 TetR/AcrR family transcriptional regulator [Rhodococcus koreensis]
MSDDPHRPHDRNASARETPPRRRGPVPAHSRDDIATAAITLTDHEGLAGLSMRAVAAALGTGAASLYRYVASRDELLALMTDHVMRELRPYPAGHDQWLDAMLEMSRRQLHLYRRHSWLVDVTQQSPAFGPEALAWLDHCLQVLEPVTASSRAKFEAIAMATGVTTLFARSELASQPALPPIDSHTYPHVARAISADATPAPTDRDLFEDALRSLLVGLLS